MRTAPFLLLLLVLVVVPVHAVLNAGDAAALEAVRATHPELRVATSAHSAWTGNASCSWGGVSCTLDLGAGERVGALSFEDAPAFGGAEVAAEIALLTELLDLRLGAFEVGICSFLVLADTLRA